MKPDSTLTGKRSLTPRRLVLAVACALALAFAATETRGAFHGIDSAYSHYASYSPTAEVDAPSNTAGFYQSLFVQIAQDLEPGDRVYFQVPSRPYGTLDLHDTVAALGRFYFLPAVEVSNLNDADIVVSYDADPAALHRKFLFQIHLAKNVVVSRLAAP